MTSLSLKTFPWWKSLTSYSFTSDCYKAPTPETPSFRTCEINISLQKTHSKYVYVVRPPYVYVVTIETVTYYAPNVTL